MTSWAGVHQDVSARGLYFWAVQIARGTQAIHPWNAVPRL